MKVGKFVISFFDSLGLFYDAGKGGDQVPKGVYDSTKAKPPSRSSAPAPVANEFKQHTTENQKVTFYQKQIIGGKDNAVFDYEIKQTKPKGKTGRKPYVTNGDAEIILTKIKSINWDTAQRIKTVWANNEGKADSYTVKALKGEKSERTVRKYTACFNAALLAQEGVSGKRYANVCKEGLTA